MLRSRVMALLALAATAAILVSLLGVDARPLPTQPAPDAQEYADSARKVADGEGLVTTIHGAEAQPTRYPPGYPLALAPFAAVGTWPYNVMRGSKAYVGLYVVLTVAAAWSLGGPLAALLAAAFVGLSPFTRDMAGFVLADVLAAALAVGVIPLLARPTRHGTRLAGLLGGFVATIRLTSITTLLALLAAAPGRGRLRAAAWAAPAVAAMLLLQWVTFGSPLETGYSYWHVTAGTFAADNASRGDLTSEGPFVTSDRLDGDLLEWTCPCGAQGPQGELPNVAFYPAVLLGLFWIYAPPLATLPGVWLAWRRRRDPVGIYATVLVLTTVALFSVYYYQAARFMAAAATVLIALSSAAIAGWLRGLRRGRAAPG